jgi:hypothetical protein
MPLTAPFNENTTSPTPSNENTKAPMPSNENTATPTPTNGNILTPMPFTTTPTPSKETQSFYSGYVDENGIEIPIIESA